MGDFLLRDIDDEILLRLKERAKRNGRSLQQELHESLRQMTRPTATEIAAMFEEFDALDDPIPADVDIVELVRDERDNRGWT